MPKVEQYDWSKLKPNVPAGRNVVVRSAPASSEAIAWGLPDAKIRRIRKWVADKVPEHYQSRVYTKLLRREAGLE